MLKRFGPVAVGTALLILYLARIDYPNLLGRARSFPMWVAALVVLLNAVPGILKLIRWRMLMGTASVRAGRGYLAVNAAFFLGLVTPGTVGEIARASMVGGAPSRGIGIVVLEKFTDLGVLGVCVVLAGIAHFVSGTAAVLLGAPVLAGALLLARVALRYDRYITALPKVLLAGVMTPSRLHELKHAYWDIRGVALHTRLMWRSALFSAMLWLLPLVQVALVYRGLGLATPVRAIALTFFLPYLVGVLSLVPLGIGVFDVTLSRLSALSGGGGTVALVPVFYRALVTLPLVLYGYGCHWMLSVRRGPAPVSCN